MARFPEGREKWQTQLYIADKGNPGGTQYLETMVSSEMAIQIMTIRTEDQC